METPIIPGPAFQSSGDLDTHLRSFQAEQTKVAAVRTISEMDVHLVTREGDKVTISLDAQAAALYGTYESFEKNDGGAAYEKSQLTAALYEREMTFTVEGDLNREERRDIRKALKALDRMMHHFSEGRMKPVLMGTRRLQRLDSIAGLEAGFSYERQTLVAEQTHIAGEYAGVAATAAPSASTADANPQIDIARPEAFQADQPAALELMAAAGTVAGDMARMVADTRTPYDRILFFVDQLLHDYREQMARFDARGVGVIDQVADRFRDALAGFGGGADGRISTVR